MAWARRRRGKGGEADPRHDPSPATAPPPPPLVTPPPGLLAACARHGALYQYRPWAEGLFVDPWARRYFSLTRTELLCWKGEQDALVSGSEPRGRLALNDVAGVEVEGLKRRRFYTFSLLDITGDALVRLSTHDVADGEQWVEALRQAGCHVLTLDEPRKKSPRRMRFNASPTFRVSRGRAPGFGAAGGREPDYDSDTSSVSSVGGSAGPDAGPAPRHTYGPERGGGIWGGSSVHREARFSVLSSERTSSESHSGLLNLGMLLIVVTHARLIIENLLKYGVRVKASFWVNALGFFDAPRSVPLVACGLSLAAFPLFALLVEHTAAAYGASRTPERLIFALNALNLVALPLWPCLVITWAQSDPLPGVILLMATLVLWMKLVSYAHACYDLRNLRRAKERGGSGHQLPWDPYNQTPGWPENISWRNLGYFLAAPTLCYQPSYPRSTRFRKRWLLRRVAELLITLGVMLLIVEQYMMPAIENSLKPFQELDLVVILDRVLKLSIPTVYVWLCMFYCFFHCWLNIVGEVVRFGDRQFYKDWWNATTIADYWKLWNIPVHKWLARHVYFPALHAGMNKNMAQMLTFFISAVLHELIIGVPCHIFRLWAFAGIMAQIPLISITNWTSKRLKNDQAGNLVFWLSFCIFGQPMCLLLYYHDYIVTHKGTS